MNEFLLVVYLLGIIGTIWFTLDLFDLHWDDVKGSGFNGLGTRFKAFMPGLFWPVGLPIVLLIARRRKGRRQAGRRDVDELLATGEPRYEPPARPEHRPRNPFDDER